MTQSRTECYWRETKKEALLSKSASTSKEMFKKNLSVKNIQIYENTILKMIHSFTSVIFILNALNLAN